MCKKIVFIHGLLGSKHNFDYLRNEFSEYETISFDLIGFGGEAKPEIDYTLEVFLEFVENKLEFERGEEYILVGHSLGAQIAKELAKKYPSKVKKIFLLGYPFLDKGEEAKNRKCFGCSYIRGSWWTRILCETRTLWKILFFPFIFLFKYKYRKSYIDYFRHTYASAYGTIHNTILKDKKEDLLDMLHKIVIINGDGDRSADLEFAKQFKHYVIDSMNHIFFEHEKEVAKIIKDNI